MHLTESGCTWVASERRLRSRVVGASYRLRLPGGRPSHIICNRMEALTQLAAKAEPSISERMHRQPCERAAISFPQPQNPDELMPYPLPDKPWAPSRVVEQPVR